jgi:hypothetical protein
MDGNMFEIITKEWGIPNIKELNNRKIEFIFNNSELPKKDTKYIELHCEEDDAKFCLYDYENNKIIFTMDFYGETSERKLNLFNTKKFITLELINVNDHTLRKKEISSYYIQKLQEYAKIKNFSYIKINPCVNAENFKNQNKENALTQKELEKFYLSKSTKEIPITFKLFHNHTSILLKLLF